MTDHAIWPVAALLLLGAFHGVNPGMGWLFAVALGMQEHRRKAVWQAMLPLAVGHGLAIGAVLLLAGLTGALLPGRVLRIIVAFVLVSLGTYRLVRQRHPRWRGGMRVGMMGLTAWSFLMASAHGAGLMVLPVVLAAAPLAPSEHGAHLAGVGGAMSGAVATGVHGVGYLLATAIAASVCYEIAGLTWLRKGWVNLDAVWAVALILTGAVAVLTI
jgi:hypothetical protein